MSVPIFRTTTESEQTTKKSQVSIPSGHEWRVEVPFRSILHLTVLDGVGEIFGTELPVNAELQLSGAKFAVYAPTGTCELEYVVVPNQDSMSSEPNELIEYISEETVMDQYLNLHFLLEQRRQNIPKDTMGPRVLIIGGKGVGKTTLARILTLYAVKMDSSPILVNLNPRDGVFALPGSLTATTCSDLFDLEASQMYGFSPTSGSLYHNPKQPIVKNFGFVDHNDNIDLYKHEVSKLSITVVSRLQEDSEKVGVLGTIIDTPALGFKDMNVIENIVSDFEVNYIVVIGNERLLLDLKKKYKHKEGLHVLKVPRSLGCVEVDEQFIRRAQEETIKEYFHGNYRTRLSPFKTDLNVSDFKIYKGVMALDVAYSFLPAGDSYDNGDLEPKEENQLDKYYTLLTEPNAGNLDNSIIAVTQLLLLGLSNKELLNTSVLGYIHVSKLDEAKGKMKVLLPFPGTFPKNVLIATGVGYQE